MNHQLTTANGFDLTTALEAHRVEVDAERSGLYALRSLNVTDQMTSGIKPRSIIGAWSSFTKKNPSIRWEYASNIAQTAIAFISAWAKSNKEVTLWAQNPAFLQDVQTYLYSKVYEYKLLNGRFADEVRVLPEVRFWYEVKGIRNANHEAMGRMAKTVIAKQDSATFKDEMRFEMAALIRQMDEQLEAAYRRLKGGN